jgi:predicted DNA-binding transcriptional regulator AlpA
LGRKGYEVPEFVDSLAAERRARRRRRNYQDRRAERVEALNHPEKANIKPAVVSVQELASASGMSAATIWRHIASGLIPSTKVLGRRLIPYSYVERLRNGG